MPARTLSAVAEELCRIAALLKSAEQRLLQHGTHGNRLEQAQAYDDRQDALADYLQGEERLADLLLCLLRHGARHRPEAMAMYLGPIVRKIMMPELQEMAEAIARQEVGA